MNNCMNKEVTLKTESGTVADLTTLDEQIEAIDAQLYWFEPDIAACIGKTLPLETLKKYHSDNWQKEPFKELMLFGNTAGMTLLKQDDGKYRYFYWQEDSNGNLGSIIKQDCKTYLRDFSQFGLDEENEEKKKYSELSKKLKITEYLHQNQRIAWTIADTEKPVEEEES